MRQNKGQHLQQRAAWLWAKSAYAERRGQLEAAREHACAALMASEDADDHFYRYGRRNA